MRLSDLLSSLDSSQITSAPQANPDITGICEDSRTVTPGVLFIARTGHQSDGHRFIADAIAKGAAAIVSDTPINVLADTAATTSSGTAAASSTSGIITETNPPHIVVKDAARTVSILAHAFYNHPSRQLRVTGITGTNGKTTTAYLLRHLLQSTSQHCGMIGTVQIDDGLHTTESTMTTPAPIAVAQLMQRMLVNHCQACAMEVSSHALDQRRVDGITFTAAAFTNLTGDHLDYHGCMEAYAVAKAHLFNLLGPDAIAAVNADDPWTPQIIRHCRARIIRFGFTDSCDYQARDIAITANGCHFVLVTPDGQTTVHMHLVGRHNIENALAAAAVAGEAYQLTVHQIAQGLATATGAPGRLQLAPADEPFTTLIDYAHTDDALKNVLGALRPLTRGQLRIVFGCGGDRDRTKRPRMARIAAQLADALYITSDNPRTENPDAIIGEILTGIPLTNGTTHDSKPVFIDPDRSRAIAQAIADAQPGDIVLIAGKGHENYQIVGTQKRHFDDLEQAQQAIAARHGIAAADGIR